MSSPPGWTVEHRRGSAAQLHALDPPVPADRRLWVLDPLRPSLVLGSTQRRSATAVAVAVAAGPDPVEVAVRRSGGGAVLVVPGACTWVDVLLPRHDPWWVDDVGRSARWLGWTWVAALAAAGVPAAVHEGPLSGADLGAMACFAGLAPGEVVAGSGGRAKLVGISQRRTRHGARFQCVVHHDHDPDRVVALLAPVVAPDRRRALRTALTEGVATVPVPPDALVAAFLAALRAGT